MTTERRKIVLDAIVRDYIATREPVGSKGVVERHHLGVSPATVRNDMAYLEEARLIIQPHTSAGRIPTDAGYRKFVDSIQELKPLSRGERAAIEKVLFEAVDLDDVLVRATRLLSQLTNQVAVVQYPSLRKTALRHVEILELSDTHLLVVIITDAGRVEQRTVSVSEPFSNLDLDTVRNAINKAFAGKQLKELRGVQAEVFSAVREHQQGIARQITEVIEETLAAENEERVVVAGAKNLTRYRSDFQGAISPLLDMLEEQVVLLRMLTSLDDGLAVQIGTENDDETLHDASIVSTSYTGGESASIGRLGVIGPTRMDYPVTMSGVYAIARYLSDVLGSP
ncbi:MAG: heat-inducible transcriptional repressor HrcA [Actinomycetaceae bacterium]|nr:heat-inducible transcriptional repressor HrcA [Actinomycetaceae bacterium]